MDPDIYMPGKNYNELISLANQNQYKWQDDFFKPEENDADWSLYYMHIHICNEIIEHIDDAPLGKIASSKRSLVKGEAYAQRALSYFYLVNEYAPNYSPTTLNERAVPIVLKIDLQAQLPRSTVEQVYQQVLSDLMNAEACMVDAPATRPEENFRPGAASLKGLLAVVYQFMNDHEKALKYSTEALAQYSYLYDYNKFSNITAGDPWSGFKLTEGGSVVEYPLDFGTDNLETLWHRYSCWIFDDPASLYSPDVVTLFDKVNDRRWILFSSQETFSGFNVAPDWCYARYGASNEVGISVPILMLVNAEAKVRLGDGAGAVAMLNKLRIKRFNSPYTPLVHEDNVKTLQLVKDERRRELFGTGLNLFDLKRYHAYGDAIPTFTRVVNGVTYTLEPGSSKYVVPICKKVKAFNPNI